MTRPGFFEGVLAAAILAAAAGFAGFVLEPLMGLAALARLLVPALAFAYLLYLLKRSRERTGRLTVLAGWATLTVATAWLSPPLLFLLAIHAGALWLVRSLYFYSGVLPALTDLALSAAATALTAWAAMQSGSLALTTWCFFLVQALFVAIPPAVRAREAGTAAAAPQNENFTRARRQAEAALQQLFTR